MGVRESILEEARLTVKWKEFPGDDGEKGSGNSKGTGSGKTAQYIQRAASAERLGRAL